MSWRIPYAWMENTFAVTPSPFFAEKLGGLGGGLGWALGLPCLPCPCGCPCLGEWHLLSARWDFVLGAHLTFHGYFLEGRKSKTTAPSCPTK